MSKKYISLTKLRILSLVLVSVFSGTVLAEGLVRSFEFSNSGYAYVKEEATHLRVSNFNVLNLFDGKDDGARQDPTFLPLSHSKKEKCKSLRSGFYKKLCMSLDWTEKKFQDRLPLVAQSVLIQGDAPDLLGLQEIENAHVVRSLARELGYKTDSFVVTNGKDPRGIDVGLIFNPKKLRLISERFLSSQSTKRDVLVARFALLNKKDFILDVYVNHWPSQANANSKHRRYKIGKLVREDIHQQAAKFAESSYATVVMGDFNVLDLEFPNGVTQALQDPEWKHHLIDIHAEARYRRALKNEPKGTYFYKNSASWNRFDRILVSQNMIKTQFKLLPKTLRIGHPDLLESFKMKSIIFQGTVKIPYRFDFLTQENQGFSDHLPVSVSFEIL